MAMSRPSQGNYLGHWLLTTLLLAPQQQQQQQQPEAAALRRRTPGAAASDEVDTCALAPVHAPLKMAS